MIEFGKLNLPERLNFIIDLAWSVFNNKASCGLIKINKEASMQLHFANILSQITDFARFTSSERIEMELEKSVQLPGRKKEVDIFISSKDESQEYRFAIELKCYRTLTSSGGKRGAQDIFKKDVYKDLESLEQCVLSRNAEAGMLLIMTDYEKFVNPRKTTSKSWIYNTSNNFMYIPGKALSEQIGGEQQDINLNQKYLFNWQKIQNYWFVKLQSNSGTNAE